MSIKLKPKMLRLTSRSLLSRMNHSNSETKRKKIVEYKDGSFDR